MPEAGFILLFVDSPDRSTAFYRDLLGMTLLDRYDFADRTFTLYFLGYPAGPIPEDEGERIEWVFTQPALLELTHNWGDEDRPALAFHDGNAAPRGFGHVGLSLPDVGAACARLEAEGVAFVKRPGDGAMKGIAFLRDPDGYWIELLAPGALRAIVMAERRRR